MQSAPASAFRLPTALPESLGGRLTLTVGASVLVALAAHISLPLPFTPVPLTLSDLAVLVIGMALGPAAAFAALLLYLLEGAAGLPVFTPGGLGGTAQLLGPTGGFLFSYPLVAALAGMASRRFALRTSRFAAGVLAGVCGSTVLFGVGATWLATLLHLTSKMAWTLAVMPFLPGNAVKIILAAAIFGFTQRFRQHS